MGAADAAAAAARRPGVLGEHALEELKGRRVGGDEQLHPMFVCLKGVCLCEGGAKRQQHAPGPRLASPRTQARKARPTRKPPSHACPHLCSYSTSTSVTKRYAAERLAGPKVGTSASATVWNLPGGGGVDDGGSREAAGPRCLRPSGAQPRRASPKRSTTADPGPPTPAPVCERDVVRGGHGAVAELLKVKHGGAAY